MLMISNCILPIDFLPDLTQTSRLEEIHISQFFAAATSRISLKAQSHAGAEESFRGEGELSDERTIHREISSKGSEWREGRQKVEMCARVCVQPEWKYMYNPNKVKMREGFNWVEGVAVKNMTEAERDRTLASRLSNLISKRSSASH